MHVKIIFILMLVSLILIPLIVTRGNTNDNNIDSDLKPINLYLSNEDDEFWDSKFLKIETPNSTLDSSEDVPKIPTLFIFQIIGNWSIWPMGNIIIEGQFGFEFWVEAPLSLNVEFMVRLYVYNGTMNFISVVQSEGTNVYGIQKIEASTEIEYMQISGRLGVEVLARANYEGCKLLYDSIAHDSHIMIDCDPFDISISEPEINSDLEIAEIQMKIYDAFRHLEDCDFQISIFGPVEGKAISNYTTEKEFRYTNVIWNWDYKKDYAIDGNYSISVIVIDYNGNHRKYSIKYFFDFPHLQIPDLWVNEISFTPNEVTEGDLLNISVTVWNIGYTDVKSAKVEFYDDTDLFKMLNVTTIEVNNYKNLSVTWLAIDAGKHVIQVKIDPNNEITEVDESNNEISQVIRISPHINNPPIINDILAEPSKINLGDSSKITVDAYDEDNDSLIYSYKISSGVIEGKGNIVTWIAPDIEGIYKIK
ncbi:MAG: hypothetical protein KAJ51_13795, partial [Thermoplasmata archaeon]|nr:hypothetical protein [Thermoplasmata archaeon]